MRNFILKTGELRDSHTAENVANCIMDGLGEFGVKWESVIDVTTDNATNYVNAVERHMECINVPCFAHCINLAVRKGLEFSPGREAEILGVKTDKLINDCLTRWNSTHDMICRALEQQAPVAAIILEKKLANLELSAQEWTQLEKKYLCYVKFAGTVKDVLRPFKVATEALSTDKYPTASAVLPMKHILLSHLREPTDVNDTTAVKEMKAKITVDLEKRYPEDSDVFMFLSTASYLDPRFHCLSHHGKQQEVGAKVLAEMTAIAEKSEVECAELSVPNKAQNKMSLSAMGDLFSQVYQQQPSAADHDLQTD
ncbi:hypothetical protein ABVT39_009655 [Epinephelus coioides]